MGVLSRSLFSQLIDRDPFPNRDLLSLGKLAPTEEAPLEGGKSTVWQLAIAPYFMAGKWWAGDFYRTRISIARAIRLLDLFAPLIPPYRDCGSRYTWKSHGYGIRCMPTTLGNVISFSLDKVS